MVAATVVLLAAVLLGACASTTGPSAAAPTSSPTAEAARAAAQYASDSPPASARMVCSDEVRDEVAGALGGGSLPAPTATWADHVYSCRYALPMGPLVLSVTVTPSEAAARDALQALQSRLAATDAEPGLGPQASSNPDGTVLAAKDNMVLQVDPTGLPDELGTSHERRLDVARLIAAAVFECWTGG